MTELSFTELGKSLENDKSEFSDIFINNDSVSINNPNEPIVPDTSEKREIIFNIIAERKQFNDVLNDITNSSFSNLDIQQFNEEILDENDFIVTLGSINDDNFFINIIKVTLNIFNRSQGMNDNQVNIISADVERTFRDGATRTGRIRNQILGDARIFTNISTINEIAKFVESFIISFGQSYIVSVTTIGFDPSIISTIVSIDDPLATAALGDNDCFLKCVYTYFTPNNPGQDIIPYDKLKRMFPNGIHNKKQIKEICDLGNIHIVILDKISNYDPKNALWIKVNCKYSHRKTVILNVSDFHATLYNDIEIHRFNKQEIKTVKPYELVEIYNKNLNQIPLIDRNGIMFALISKHFIYKTFNLFKWAYPNALTENSIYFKDIKEYGKVKQSKYFEIWKQACSSNGFITNIKIPDPKIKLYKFDENKSYQSAYIRINNSVGFPNGNDECYKYDNTPEQQTNALKLIFKYNGCSYIIITKQPDLLMNVFYKGDNIYVNEEIKFAIDYCKNNNYTLEFIIKNVLINKTAIYNIFPSEYLYPAISLIFNKMIGKCNPQNYFSIICTRDPNEFLHILYSLRRNSNYKIIGVQLNKNRIMKQSIDEILEKINIIRKKYYDDYKKHIDEIKSIIIKLKELVDSDILSNKVRENPSLELCSKEYINLHNKLLYLRSHIPDEERINPLLTFIEIHILKVEINNTSKLTDLLKIYFQSKEEIKFRAPHISAQIYAFQKIKMIKLINIIPKEHLYAIRVDSITIPKHITEKYINKYIPNFKLSIGSVKLFIKKHIYKVRYPKRKYKKNEIIHQLYKIEKYEYPIRKIFPYKVYPLSKTLITQLDNFKYTETDICSFSPLIHWSGQGGSGKSYDARKLNLDNIVYLSPTHTANKELEGDNRIVMTIHKFLGLGCRPYCDLNTFAWIFIDEISMCTYGMAKLLKEYHERTGCYIIISGDFAQLLVEGILGIPFRNHPFYKLFKIIDYLDDYRRDKDQTEFSEMLCKMRNIILHNLDLPKKDKKKLTQELINYFNKRVDRKIYKSVYKIIAGTNSTRRTYNQQKLSQKLDLIPIVCTRKMNQMLNGDEGEYIRSTKKANINILSNRVRKKIEWKQESYIFLPNNIKVNYSCTIHSAQGKTYDFKYLIHNKSIWSLSQLYTALSRSKRITDVYLTHPLFI